jgi:hypothetical protein
LSTKDFVRPDKGAEVPRDVPVVLVTPAMAKEWLSTRYENERPLHKNKIRAFARDMDENNWYFIGDVIRFSPGGERLMDGQHRLQAIIDSGKAQWFGIVNLPEEARSGIDTGSARTLGELLHMGNHVHGRVVAAIARRVLIYRNGQQATSGGKYLPTHAEGLQFAEQNTRLLKKAAELGIRVTGRKAALPVAASSLGAAYFLCAQVDEEQADEVFGRIVSGLGLTQGDPVAAYRNRAVRMMEQFRNKMSPDDAFRFAIVTWNHVRNGNKIERLLTPREGWNPRNIPVPK